MHQNKVRHVWVLGDVDPECLQVDAVLLVVLPPQQVQAPPVPALLPCREAQIRPKRVVPRQQLFVVRPRPELQYPVRHVPARRHATEPLWVEPHLLQPSHGVGPQPGGVGQDDEVALEVLRQVAHEVLGVRIRVLAIMQHSELKVEYGRIQSVFS